MMKRHIIYNLSHHNKDGNHKNDTYIYFQLLLFLTKKSFF